MCHFNEFIPRNVVWIFRAAGDGAGIYAEKTPPFDGVCGSLERLFLGNLNHLSIHLHSVKSVQIQLERPKFSGLQSLLDPIL